MATLLPLLLLLRFSSPALSAPADRSTYIVHMTKSAMPRLFADSHSCHSSTLESFSHDGISPDIVYTYEHATDGFSVVLTSEQLQALSNTPGFVLAYRDTQATVDTTHTFEFLSPTTGIWNASKYGDGAVSSTVVSGLRSRASVTTAWARYPRDGKGNVWRGKPSTARCATVNS